MSFDKGIPANGKERVIPDGSFNSAFAVWESSVHVREEPSSRNVITLEVDVLLQALRMIRIKPAHIVSSPGAVSCAMLDFVVMPIYEKSVKHPCIFRFRPWRAHSWIWQEFHTITGMRIAQIAHNNEDQVICSTNV